MRRRWWSAGAPLMAGLLAVGTAGIMALSGGESASAQQGSLADLARRAIGGPGGAQTVTLMPGERATDMPLNLPLPAGANVVGTIKRDFNPAPVKMWDLVIDVGASPADVGAFFDQALPAMGWTAPPPAGDQGAPQGAFCQSADGPWIGVVAVPVSETASDLRVHVESGSPGPCAGPQQPPAQ